MLGSILAGMSTGEDSCLESEGTVRGDDALLSWWVLLLLRAVEWFSCGCGALVLPVLLQ